MKTVIVNIYNLLSSTEVLKHTKAHQVFFKELDYIIMEYKAIRQTETARRT